MRTHLIVCALVALSLSACQKKVASAPEAAADVASAPAPATPVKPTDRTAPAAAVSIPQLAYAYHYALAAPPKAVRGLLAEDESACRAAGPAVCQVTSASVTEDGPDRINAALSLRAEPVWLGRFRQTLEARGDHEGVRILGAQTASEDLSRQIVDTEAAIRAKTLLRDRLEGLLATRNGKLSDLLEVEQQLAQVQGEIDATQSELAAMRNRVAMSALDIEYRSDAVLAPRGVLAPVAAAAADVAGVLAGSLAILNRALAALALPSGLAALAWWLIRRRRRPAAPTA